MPSKIALCRPEVRRRADVCRWGYRRDVWKASSKSKHHTFINRAGVTTAKSLDAEGISPMVGAFPEQRVVRID